jgi:hypothetical protein
VKTFPLANGKNFLFIALAGRGYRNSCTQNERLTAGFLVSVVLFQPRNESDTVDYYPCLVEPLGFCRRSRSDGLHRVIAEPDN